jgi:hypothetical protein
VAVARPPLLEVAERDGTGGVQRVLGELVEQLGGTA